MNKIIIKPIAKADVDSLNQHLGFGEHTRYTPTSHQHSWERQQQDEISYLIAWEDQIPVGHLAISWKGDATLNKLANTPICPYIYRVLVHPKHRQKGIATKLMKKAEILVQDRGFKKIGLGVAIDNLKALSIYKQLGYKTTGQKYLFDMEYIDIVGKPQKETERCEYYIKQL